MNNINGAPSNYGASLKYDLTNANISGNFASNKQGSSAFQDHRADNAAQDDQMGFAAAHQCAGGSKYLNNPD